MASSNPTILFYISGHGYGHARRMTQVMRELATRRPDVAIRVRTAAPARIFDLLPAGAVQPSEVDAGVVEIDPLTIDRERSLERLSHFMARRETIIAAELTAVREIMPTLIVADIPFLAGDMACKTGVPCIGISNFTWDWIYDGLFGDDPAYARLSQSIRDSYSKFTSLLELPFGRTCPTMSSKIPTPLIAMWSNRNPDEVLEHLGISPSDSRPRVLIGTRGALPPGTLARAAAEAPEFLFLCPRETTETLPANALALNLGAGLDFSDVLNISHVMVSKLGYGIVSECIATNTPLVWPPRVGFAEDAVMQEQASKYFPMLKMPAEDYRAGNWAPSLRAALRWPKAPQVIQISGASVCAEILAKYL